MARRLPWTLLAAIVPLLGWWSYGLFDLDEGFYAAIAAEMNRRGEWITPFFNGEPWFEKPILIYWLMKPSLMLFGDMIGPRLPSVLATIGLYVLCAWFAKRRLSEEAARWVPLVLGSSLLVVGAGRMALTDPLLDLSLTGAFLTFWESLVGDRRWRLATAACLGLAVLAKGPVAGLLFIPTVGWLAWRRPSTREAFKGQWWAGVAIFVVVVAAWYLPCYLQNGQLFVQKFLIEQNVGRFTGGDKAHEVPFFPWGWAFYPLLILLGFAPWSFLLPASWRKDSDLSGYLKAWAVVVLVFFTISKAKLPHYILPAIPPLGLLVAGYLGERKSQPLKALPWVAAVAVIAQGGFWIYYYGSRALNLPGFHAEIHRLTRYVRTQAAPTDEVAMFQMPKRKGLPRRPGIHIDETSHPSALLYLDRTALETSDWSEILKSKVPVWILTRYNRVTPEDMAAAGARLKAVDPFPPDLYRLYRLDPVPSNP